MNSTWFRVRGTAFRSTIAALALGLLAAAGGCGQRGPLYLPEPAPVPEPQPAPAADGGRAVEDAAAETGAAGERDTDPSVDRGGSG